MGNVSVNGVDLHYWTVGEGPDIVMLHGLGGNLAIWHMHVVPLLRDKFRLTTFDMRGHGRSGMPQSGYTTRHIAEDVRGLMDALGIEKAHLAGHSMGADVSLHFAMCYPERADRLVLVEAGLPALVAARKDESWVGWSYWAEMIETYTGEPVPPELPLLAASKPQGADHVRPVSRKIAAASTQVRGVAGHDDVGRGLRGGR